MRTKNFVVFGLLVLIVLGAVLAYLLDQAGPLGSKMAVNEVEQEGPPYFDTQIIDGNAVLYNIDQWIGSDKPAINLDLSNRLLLIIDQNRWDFPEYKSSEFNVELKMFSNLSDYDVLTAMSSQGKGGMEGVLYIFKPKKTGEFEVTFKRLKTDTKGGLGTAVMRVKVTGGDVK